MKKGIFCALAAVFIASSILGCTAVSGPEPTAAPTPTTTPEPLGKPNVYFFVLDEYSSFDMLSKYYGYDNKVFDDFLGSKGFNISRESYATDNQTEYCFCDLLNLKYMSRRLSQSECFRAISNAELYSVFSDLGYAQFQFSLVNRYFRGIQSLNSAAGREAYEAITLAGVASKGTEGGSTANEQTSPAATGAQLNEWGVYTSAYIRSTKAYKQHEDRPHAEAFLKIFDYFENPANYAATKPRVTYCYMEAAHVPFVFDEFGGILPHSQIRNWRDEEIYLGQYKYITKHMTAIISTIIENDPKSIIIVMSDHGIRYHADCTRKHAFYITDKDSCRIMNAVYIKGDRYDIEGLSGINTLRYILGLYDLKDFPPIKDPITADSPDKLAGIIPKPR